MSRMSQSLQTKKKVLKKQYNNPTKYSNLPLVWNRKIIKGKETIQHYPKKKKKNHSRFLRASTIPWPQKMELQIQNHIPQPVHVYVPQQIIQALSDAVFTEIQTKQRLVIKCLGFHLITSNGIWPCLQKQTPLKNFFSESSNPQAMIVTGGEISNPINLPGFA